MRERDSNIYVCVCVCVCVRVCAGYIYMHTYMYVCSFCLPPSPSRYLSLSIRPPLSL